MYLNDLGTFNTVCFQCYIVDIKILGNAYSLPILVGKLSLVRIFIKQSTDGVFRLTSRAVERSDFDILYDAVYIVKCSFVKFSRQSLSTDKVANPLFQVNRLISSHMIHVHVQINFAYNIQS